jgi:hypothetical protein
VTRAARRCWLRPWCSARRSAGAYAELADIFDPDDAAYHRFDQFMEAGRFAEAGIGSGAIEPAREVITALMKVAGTSSTLDIRAGLL